VVYPPVAPPRDLPSVELIISTYFSIPKYSGIPFPFFPNIPVAWL